MMIAAFDSGAIAGPIFLMCIMGLMYFLPLFVAHARHHRNATSIGVLNVFLGWTVIGWVVCLAWAFSADVQTVA